MEKNIDATAYENNLNQDVNIPSIKKIFDRNNKNELRPIIIKESLNWLPFLISWSSLQTGQIMIKDFYRHF